MIDEINVAAEEDSSGKADVLSIFGSGLQQQIRKLCQEKLPIERRWVDDMRQFMGQYDQEVINKMPKGGAQVFINVTKPKTLKGEAQLVDMLFPVDDKNYGISPTPNPDLSLATSSDRQVYDKDGNPLQFSDDKSPVTEGDVAKAHLELAEEKCKSMEREIDDQLIECDYSASCRKMIHYAAVLGTGIVCGPEVEQRELRSWTQTPEGKFVMAFQLDKRPIVRHVLPWDFFPDLSATTIQECGFIFERSYLSAKSLRRLNRIPGVVKENLDRLIKDTGGNGKSTQNFSEHVSSLREMSGIIGMTEDSRYELWRYRGPIKKEVMISAGVIDPKDKDAPDEMDGIVIFCGDVVLKAAVNPMESEDWPYSVFCWEKDDNCIFGYGVPHDGSHMQSIINTSARLMLDNATKSAGPQIVFNNRVEPVDGSYEVAPWKCWKTSDPTTKVSDAFDIFNFPSVQAEIANIYNWARALFDEVTGLPVISEGEQGQVTPTVGGMSMLINAATTTRRNQVKHFDDDVTVPMIQRFYDWNMQFNTDDSIKGDMKVFARGTSALLAKEEKLQALITILNNYGGHPIFAKFFKNQGLDAFRMMIKSAHINPDDIVIDADLLKSMIEKEQELAQSSPQEEDPRVTAQKIAAQSKQESLAVEREMHNETNQTNLAISQINQQTELEKLATQENISLQEASLDFKKASQQLDLAKSEFITETQLKLQHGDRANYGLGQ